MDGVYCHQFFGGVGLGVDATVAVLMLPESAVEAFCFPHVVNVVFAFEDVDPMNHLVNVFVVYFYTVWIVLAVIIFSSILFR